MPAGHMRHSHCCAPHGPCTSSVCASKDKDYSFNVRERVWAAHKDRPGYLVASHVPGYHRLSATAKFCLAPAGTKPRRPLA